MQAIGNSETAAAMRILNLTSHQLFPVVSGGQSDVLRFLEALSPHHDLYVFGEEGGLNRAQLPQAQMVEGLPRGKQKYASPRAALRFLRAVRSIEPDVIVIDYPWFGALAMIARLLFGVPYIVHEHNAEYVRFRRLGRWWWWMLAGYEAAVCWGARFVFCKTAADKAALTGSLKINAEKIIELPYGIDRDVFRPNPEARRRLREEIGLGDVPVALFNGGLRYQANRQAAEIIEREIAPRLLRQHPDLVVMMVGSDPPFLGRRSNLLYTGWVERIEDFIVASDVIVVPLIAGGGIRTKIIEAIACGVPVVSTTIGAEGIDRDRCADHLIVTDDWDAFAEATIACLTGPHGLVDPRFYELYEIRRRVKSLGLHEDQAWQAPQP